MPGSAFLRPEEELTTRFCYVDFDGTKAMEVLMDKGELINNEKFVQDNAPKIVQGIQNLKAFVKECCCCSAE